MASGTKREQAEAEDEPEDDEQLDFEVMQVKQCELLRRGAEWYDKLVSKPGASSKGSLHRAGLPADVGLYAVIDLASKPSANSEAINQAAFKLRVLLTHTYWSQQGWLRGAHVNEVSEFTGSARMVRLVLFVAAEHAERARGPLLKWLANVTTLVASVKVGGSVADVLNSVWDGSVSALWRAAGESRSEEEDKEEESEEEARESGGGAMPIETTAAAQQQQQQQPHGRRRKAFDSALESLGLHTSSILQVAIDSVQDETQPNQESEHKDQGQGQKQSVSERERERIEREALRRKVPTRLGLNGVRALLEMFDEDKDGMLSLREMNLMLRRLALPEFATQDDYRAAFAEDGLDTAQSGWANLKTLAQAYVAAPQELLARDLGRCGLLSSSLADCPFQLSLDVAGSVLGRTHEQTQGSLDLLSDALSVLDTVRDGAWPRAIKETLWRPRAQDASFELQFANWNELFREHAQTIQAALPPELFECLQRAVFEPGYARNVAAGVRAIASAIKRASVRAQRGCQDDEDEEADGGLPEDDLLRLDLLQAPSVPQDFVQREMLKMLSHLAASFKNTISGVNKVNVGFADDRSVAIECAGLDCFDWFLHGT